MLQSYAKFWRRKTGRTIFKRGPLTSGLKICEWKWVLMGTHESPLYRHAHFMMITKTMQFFACSTNMLFLPILKLCISESSLYYDSFPKILYKKIAIYRLAYNIAIIESLYHDTYSYHQILANAQPYSASQSTSTRSQSDRLNLLRRGGIRG